MKIVTHPVTGQQFKLARKVPSFPHNGPSMTELESVGVLPNITPPVSTFYSPAAATSLHNIYMNDALGDCVIAGGFHVRGLASMNSGTKALFTQAQVLHDYGAIGGYDPGKTQPDGSNPTDQGCDENTALDYWQKTGFPDGVNLVGSVAIDPANVQQIRLAMYLFENVYFGVGLPDDWINPFPSGPGFRWDVAGDSDPNNGHCFIGCDLVPHGVKIDTWGMTGYITFGAIAKYASNTSGGQLFTLLTPDIIAKASKKSPAGYDITALTSYLKQL